MIIPFLILMIVMYSTRTIDDVRTLWAYIKFLTKIFVSVYAFRCEMAAV